MGRLSHSRALGVWQNGLRVARWLLPANGTTELSYDPEWVAAPEGRPLSLSLPINLDGQPIKGNKVEFFFDNLLPDSVAIRRRIQQRFATKTGAAFDLLEAIGRDCVGAVQLLPDGEAPSGIREINATPLTEADVEKTLLGVASDLSRPDDDDDFRISLAGAQEKTALIWHAGRWCKPHQATPTTHIFKLPLGLVGGRKLDLSASLENEWLCAQILTGFGVPVAACELKRFAATAALVVERFDRKLHATRKYWLRLPQEDFCQATGTPSSRKYETDGGPGVAAITGLLQTSEARESDLTTFLRAQLLFWLLAATDGHAKNFSIHLLAQGRYRLTPLYDVLSAWPISGERANQIHPKKLKLAMALRGANKHYLLDTIGRRHFNATAKESGFGPDMNALIDDTVAQIPAVIKRVAERLPRSFPPRLFDSITVGMQKAARRL